MNRKLLVITVFLYLLGVVFFVLWWESSISEYVYEGYKPNAHLSIIGLLFFGIATVILGSHGVRSAEKNVRRSFIIGLLSVVAGIVLFGSWIFSYTKESWELEDLGYEFYKVVVYPEPTALILTILAIFISVGLACIIISFFIAKPKK